MSHKATNWAIEQRGLRPATKLVLWHLCDRHHPDNGCFPSQETLAHDCEMSRSSVNEHLKLLEDAGLIRRIQRSDRKNRRRISTLYLFAFDFPDGDARPDAEKPDPAPSNDSGEAGETDDPAGKPCPDSGHGAVSEKPRKPCPEIGKSHVQNLDTNPVREPLKNPRARADGDGLSKIAAFWVEQIKAARTAGSSSIAPAVADEIRRSGLLSEAQLKSAGIDIRKRAG
ncbi:hypothetical protein BOO69_08210 [Sulfitobacter alexandrii]|uniref:Helix-turn-helix domain-containing protein n=1 Tax=Sulfitobacter alexandrii TaxID=1917485 RepID=A0A1J0WGT8_9RHOB|nr:helix-turn-helix domain-containing protein [Sulfitobacter alexandrii]APE43400.1 hypothetical protein BOO69_08210 [Sulfitobacter alexandrii]